MSKSEPINSMAMWVSLVGPTQSRRRVAVDYRMDWLYCSSAPESNNLGTEDSVIPVLMYSHSPQWTLSVIFSTNAKTPSIGSPAEIKTELELFKKSAMSECMCVYVCVDELQRCVWLHEIKSVGKL
ncbi:uncharacterized protein CIMG_12788 [Coccidioides immitis RS]|uniref:Uncharacterized protein n=1 Tax=Coccidioides immitis (strain RS) TaxID=246410 RepID=A0A0D8JS60_COCIM|nr:uncharacterized protein CIMG_12788 [Coccidioides immitis RS]KJF60165.1 hypothetical protein CIMG_12788 [Coccidioides immitis RS]